MRIFLQTFLAVVVAAALALFVYDRYVLVPRLDDVSDAARVSLADARNEAREIATELDASVERSVATAQTAFKEQAQAEDARRAEREAQAEQMRRTALAADALARAQGVKGALVEHYMSMGQWPANIGDLGMGQPTDFAGGPVASITVEPEGVIAINLQPEVAVGARLRLVPRVTPAGMVEWRCKATGYPPAEGIAACKP